VKNAGYWRELENTVVHVDPEQPKHAQQVDMSGEYEGHGLEHFQSPGIVYRSLQHGAVHYAEP
jgi:hypothetical protein